MARTLHPETKKIFYVADATPAGEGLWRQIESMSSGYPDLQFFRIDDSLSLSEIEERVTPHTMSERN